jgi:RNA polymerase sigma factor (sigma-70 family)
MFKIKDRVRVKVDYTKDIKIRGKVHNMTFNECYRQFEVFRNSLSYKYKSLPLEREDIEQEISMSFYKAYETYDINRGYEFITVAQKTIQNDLSKIYRSINTNKRKVYKSIISLNSHVRESKEKQIEVLDTISSDGFENITCEMIDMIKKINNLDYTHSLAIKLLYQGYKQDEIAEILNCNQVNISRYKRSFKQLIDKEREVS